MNLDLAQLYIACKHFFIRIGLFKFKTEENKFANYYYIINISSIMLFFKPGAIRLAALNYSGTR